MPAFHNEEMPWCCGIEVLGGFDDDDFTSGDIKAHLEKVIVQYMGVGRAMFLASTAPHQETVIKALTEFGFTPIKEAKRIEGASYNPVTLWIYYAQDHELFEELGRQNNDEDDIEIDMDEDYL